MYIYIYLARFPGPKDTMIRGVVIIMILFDGTRNEPMQAHGNSSYGMSVFGVSSYDVLCVCFTTRNVCYLICLNQNLAMLLHCWMHIKIKHNKLVTQMKKDEQPCVYNFPVVSKQVFGQHVSRVEDVHIGEGGDQDSLEGRGGRHEDFWRTNGGVYEHIMLLINWVLCSWSVLFVFFSLLKYSSNRAQTVLQRGKHSS